MDVNKDTVVDFNEWVRVLGTYCMFTLEDLQKFVFASFDSDGDGFLGKIDSLYNTNTFSHLLTISCPIYECFIPLNIFSLNN